MRYWFWTGFRTGVTIVGVPKEFAVTDRRRFLKTLAAGVAVGALPGLAARARDPAFGGETTGQSLRSDAPFEVVALGRLGFGPRPSDLEAFKALGPTDSKRLARYVDAQLYPESVNDKACEDKIAALGLTTLTKPLKTLWADHAVAANAMREAEKAADAKGARDKNDLHPKRDENKLRQQPVRETEIATWLKIVYSRRQLREVLVDFWHNHFNVFGWDNQIAPVFAHYDRDVIRKHALGNFRQLLGAVARSPAMLFYLDNFLNQSGNPNENFARELFELHTLGAENYLGTGDRASVPGYGRRAPVGYVDGDVYEAARALTGWRVDQGKNSGNTGEFSYYDAWHDRFQKIVLGTPLREYQPAMKDGEDVLDLVAYHPGTSRYVSRKLCRRLICDEPSAQLVESVAKVFRDSRKSPDQLRQVVRAVALSKEFQTMPRQKMKRPLEAVASMLRSTEADFFPSEPFLNTFARAGQRLFQWRTPDGYPDSHVRWGGSTPMLERWRMANQICCGWIEGVRIDWAAAAKQSGDTPAQLARYWSDRVLGYPMNAAAVAELAEVMAQGQNSALSLSPQTMKERLPAAVALALMSPEFQWR